MQHIDIEPPRPSERRYRRSEDITQALAFQCAHVQQQLGLQALVVADDVGDRWVGAGDRTLCRILSRGANDLAVGSTANAAYRFKVLQSMKEDLEPGHLTTFTLRVPNRQRLLHVAGVGAHNARADGVVTTAGGARRILGFVPQRPSREVDATDGEGLLRKVFLDAWYSLQRSGGLTGEAPRRGLGRTTDHVYRNVLDTCMQPVTDILHRSGLLADEPWGAWRSGRDEIQLGGDHFVRAVRYELKEIRTGTRIGTLILEFEHRHLRWDMPAAPRLFLRWRT
ncbi:MAG: hypothetical protein EA398_05205 [Deltaproteobacteria bacterium]|nr:MAG: hypothetical protein EA398_05205 [Deltaproteobacteria bacterium]